jgi:hypothetical protein
MGLVVLGPVLLILAIILVFRARSREKRVAALTHVDVKRDWQPTGNINFVGPEDAADQDRLFLEIEENRVIELLGGGQFRNSFSSRYTG